MLRNRVNLVAWVAGGVLLASACSDTTQPNTTTNQTPSAPDLRTAQQPEADPNGLARGVRGLRSAGHTDDLPEGRGAAR